MDPNSKTDRSPASPREDAGLRHRLTSAVAALVLALMTGVPLQSTAMLFPDPEESAAPYLGF